MSSPATPVTQPERIVALDAVRGFAVLGILVMNVQSLSMPMSTYLNPSAFGHLEGSNWWIWMLSHMLAERKFITTFSLLFGAGIILFAEHAEARGRKAAGLHYRRMLWLLLFGAAHAYLLWYGDILFTYAVCGMLVYPLRKLSPRKLLVTGLVLIAFESAFNIFLGWSMPYWPREEVTALQTETWQPPPERIEWELAAYRGGWLRQMQHRAPEALFLETQYLLMFELWHTGGVMLLGMALYKWGMLTAQRSVAFYSRWLAFGPLAGLPMIGYGVYRNLQAGWSMQYSFFTGTQFNNWGSLLVSLAYISMVVLAVKGNWMPWFTRRLAATGQMAFTNYIAHTLLCTTLFYGHGFGLYGRVERLGQLGIVVAIWLLQLWYSPLWLARFRFGPLEWLWRSLTYSQLQPFRR
jgi:uncharacterized protein